jgi:ectoine hydroxylase-related dioxygenase (phytanoyl-CoA dioxygenase family)
MLTDAQREALRTRGWTVVPDVFAPSEVETMRAAMDALVQMARDAQLDGMVMHRGTQFVVDRDDDAPDGLRVHRIVWCAGASEVLDRFGTDPRVLRIAADILGQPELVQLINQAHPKRPGDGVAFEWHQDSRHRRFGTPEWTDVNGRGSFVETATALDPLTVTNGTLHFVEGTASGTHIPFDPVTRQLPEDSFDPEAAVPALCEPGSVVVFGPFVVHGSGPNRSNGPRRLFLNGFALPGANRRVYPGCGLGRPVRAPS